MSIPLSLAGKVAVITGGSRGVGAATVRMFVAAEAKVLFSYEKAQERAEGLVAELGASNCQAMACDLSDIDAAQKLVDEAVGLFGRVDILIVNHAVYLNGAPIDVMSAAQWRKTLAINLDGVFGVVKCSVAQMKKQKRLGDTGGHIVLVSSTAAQRGEAFHADYAASKGALISLVKSLATELASDNIHVNCVAPGWIETDMSAASLADVNMRAAIFASIPLRRVANPDEIAAPILFLCTPQASFITGEVLNVNGGAVLAG